MAGGLLLFGDSQIHERHLQHHPRLRRGLQLLGATSLPPLQIRFPNLGIQVRSLPLSLSLQRLRSVFSFYSIIPVIKGEPRVLDLLYYTSFWCLFGLLLFLGISFPRLAVFVKEKKKEKKKLQMRLLIQSLLSSDAMLGYLFWLETDSFLKIVRMYLQIG